MIGEALASLSVSGRPRAGGVGEHDQALRSSPDVLFFSSNSTSPSASSLTTGSILTKVVLSFNYTVRQHDASAELYIDRGKESGTENEDIFDQLAESKEEIEVAFGENLDWQRLEGACACRIKKQIDLGGYRDESQWLQVQDAMIDAMIRLEKALRAHLKALKV
jgi:Domain of unknown function (DUF4268)